MRKLILAALIALCLAGCASALETTAPPTLGTTAPGTETTENPITEPIVTDPTVTEPPVTEAPVTEPSITEPAPTEHVHAYTEQIQVPSCTEKGYTLFTCDCGHSYKDHATEATGHNWREWVITKEPTQSSAGLAERSCANCNAAESKALDAIEAGLTVLTWPETIHRNEDGTVTIKGKPNTLYTITVYYKSGPSKAKGLEAKTSDSDGTVSWTWHIGGKTAFGTYKIVISGGGETKTLRFTIVE